MTLRYCSTITPTKLNNRTNVKTMDVRTRVLWNGAKTEMFAPQNDCATERNINFLLTAIVSPVESASQKFCLVMYVNHTYHIFSNRSRIPNNSHCRIVATLETP